jgi:hypothetical protein
MVTCSALTVLRRKPEAPKAAFRLPWGVAFSGIGVALGVWLLSNSNLREARDTAIATAIGLCIYALTRMFKRQSA